MKFTKKEIAQLERAGKMLGKDFFISYAVAGSGPTGDETALVKSGNGSSSTKYYILNGDWREHYKPLVKKGYAVCKKFFDSKKKQHLNFWSD